MLSQKVLVRKEKEKEKEAAINAQIEALGGDNDSSVFIYLS
jgi:hypothetical protein